MIDINSLPIIEPDWQSPTTHVWRSCAKNAQQLMTGTLLCIDPSIGSMSSQPGYAVFVAGQLVDSGLLRGAESGAHNRRLYEISRSIREDFTEFQFDVLVTEDLPALRFNKFGRSLQSQVPLHRAVGAIMSALPIPVCIEVPPRTWRSFLYLPQYDKGDEADAVMLGYAAIQTAIRADWCKRKGRKALPGAGTKLALEMAGRYHE